MNILGTGLNGLIGSRIVEILSPKYTFENVSRQNGVDITDYSSLLHAFKESPAQTVIHAAAYTDVKTAEREKELGTESSAWKINVIGTQNVVRACTETGKKIIHFSTDLVVGGDDMPDGGFTEEAKPNPLNWYAETKLRAEKVIKEHATSFIIMRLAYPYRAAFVKPDFVRFFINTLSNKTQISALTDRLISPTYIDDIANAIDVLIQAKAVGIFNTVGSQILSIYDAALLIAEVFDLDSKLIGKTTRQDFLVNRPGEPFSSALNNDKIRKLGAKMSTFEQGLENIKEQL